MKNQKGIGYIPCEVSGRYLMFDNHVHDNGLIMMDVMTNNGEADKKLCEMVLNFDDLAKLVAEVSDSRKD